MQGKTGCLRALALTSYRLPAVAPAHARNHSPKPLPVDRQDKRGNTPLIKSCSNGRAEVAELLLAAGADLNARSAVSVLTAIAAIAKLIGLTILPLLLTSNYLPLGSTA